MPVDPISGSMSSVKPETLKPAETLSVNASPDKSVAGNSPAKDQPKAELPNAFDPQAKDRVSISSKPASVEKVEKVEKDKKPPGVVSHVVESYNLKGELRTKFLDSRNNVVYQIPSEMVAKMQDLMLKSNTSANIKG